MRFVIIFLGVLLMALPIAAQQTAPVRVTFSWTAPGDDSTTGTASKYDIRYSTRTINLLNWDSSNVVFKVLKSGSKVPLPAGSLESMIDTLILGNNTTVNFVLRTADEVPNWSGLSNVKIFNVGDIIPPAIVIDFNVVKQ